MSRPPGTEQLPAMPPIDQATLPSPAARSRLLGHQVEYAADPLGAFRRWTSDCGDAVRLRFGPTRVLLLTSPDAVEDVLVRNAGSFRKAPVIRRASRTVIGDSVFSTEGQAWSRQRDLLEGFFAPDRMAAHVPVIVEEVAATAARWTPGVVVETLRETMALSQRIGARVLFGSQATEADVERVAAALAVTAADFQERVDSIPRLLAPEWLPTPWAVRRRRAVGILDGVAYGLIRSRRQRSLDAADILGWLLRRQSDLAWLTDRLVRDNVVTMLVESREDPALLLTWALYLLARHPDVADRLATEIETTLRGREPGATDLPRLLLADAVLRETLRLYPPVYSTGREAIRDCTVDGIAVKRGAVVLLSQAVTHRDAGRFPDPDAFRPDRWRDPAIGSLPAGAYAPFNLGPRRCLGEHLAWTIGLVGLAMLARDRRYVAIDGQPVQPKVLLSLRPSREVQLRVEGR